MKMKMEDLEKEVKEELIHSLYEWGVNRSNKEHVRFRQQAIKHCVATLSEGSDGQIDYQALKRDKFPSSYADAYEHVLRNDDMSDNIYLCTDRLGQSGYLEPFRRTRDRRTGEINGYKLKSEYQGFSSEQIEPLDRFRFESMAKEELFFGRWFLEDDEAASGGNLFEAMLACHALKSQSCYNCKFQKALRWNGGGKSSWQDMICTNSDCEAMYEVKTKADMERVEKVFHYNNLSGGSFSTYCQLANSKKSTQKMYVVILPRKPTFNRKREKVFPVTIAEIDKVLPKVSESSFNPNYTSIRFKSTVCMKLNSKAKWFDLPLRGEVIEMGQIAERVFKERFSEETYDHFFDKYFVSNGSDSENEAKEEVQEGEVEDPVDAITKRLDEVEIPPDDWEDLASDSE